jgi:hypothetical protein
LLQAVAQTAHCRLSKLAGPSNYWAQGIGEDEHLSFMFYNISLISSSPAEEPVEPEYPGTHPGGGGASCVFTITITSTNGISGTGNISGTGEITPTEPITTAPVTATVVYSQNANLVTNSSFERSGGGGPADWDQVQDGSFRDYDWSDWWRSGSGAAKTGSRYMLSGYPFDLHQDVTIRGSEADYVAGYFARCANNPGCNEAFNLYWNPFIMPGITPPILVHGDVNSTSYAEYTGTKTMAGSGTAIIMVRPLGNQANLDDVFVYPIDDAGNLLCDPTLYPWPL